MATFPHAFDVDNVPVGAAKKQIVLNCDVEAASLE